MSHPFTTSSTDVQPLPSDLLTINIGPAHPATHGTLRLQVQLDGETIVNCGAEIGYLHRGFEKQVEACQYQLVIPYTERLNYMGPVHNSNAWCYACEGLLGIEAPARAVSPVASSPSRSWSWSPWAAERGAAAPRPAAAPGSWCTGP